MDADRSRLQLSYKNEPQSSCNVRDEDGDTPLFFAEDVPTAQLLVELGADAKLKNDEGLTAAEKATVNEIYDVAEYLRSLTGEEETPRRELLVRLGEEHEEDALDGRIVQADASSDDGPSDAQVDAVMARIEEIMKHADETGADPTDELRELVGASVMRQIMQSSQHE